MTDLPTDEELELLRTWSSTTRFRMDQTDAHAARAVASLLDGYVATRRERDAYRKAKSENDERFMIERDEARAEAKEMRLRAEMAEADCVGMEKRAQRAERLITEATAVVFGSAAEMLAAGIPVPSDTARYGAAFGKALRSARANAIRWQHRYDDSGEVGIYLPSACVADRSEIAAWPSEET